MKTWFVSGADRAMGAEIARAALRNGDRVVAAAPRKSAIAWARGVQADRLLLVDLDATIIDQALAAVAAAEAAFGGIDVLVNNAGYGLYGFFEESSADDAWEQMATNFIGVLNATWAALPLMRKARKGHIFNFSSPGAVAGAPSGSLYCASKCAVEGFSKSLAEEVAPFGIGVTIVESDRDSSNFLSPRSTRSGFNHIADYDERRAQFFSEVGQRKDERIGDPTGVADTLIKLADVGTPPLRLLACSTMQKRNAHPAAALVVP